MCLHTFCEHKQDTNLLSRLSQSRESGSITSRFQAMYSRWSLPVSFANASRLNSLQTFYFPSLSCLLFCCDQVGLGIFDRLGRPTGKACDSQSLGRIDWCLVRCSAGIRCLWRLRKLWSVSGLVSVCPGLSHSSSTRRSGTSFESVTCILRDSKQVANAKAMETSQMSYVFGPPN